ncbi:MAG: tetratricopeptide repeat protein [Betaproteobacteria bacterium]|nr:MAG: tetratricopeptide repeat protein [Betaproteobacteria bacterium]
MNTVQRHASIIALMAASAALAAPGDDPSAGAAAAADPVIEKVLAANAQADWRRSQALLREALGKDPRNADYHNLYAYAIRKGPDPSLDLVFKHYHEALRINPTHRGAHEYIGEAYLMQRNLAKAKEHLDALDRMCFFGCEEYSMLKKAVAEFEANSAKK